METTTDFEEWLEYSDIQNADEAHSVEQAILTGDNWGGYYIKENRGQIFLYSDSHDCVLRLASENAKAAFLKRLQEPYEFDLDTQRWIDKQMAKDD